MIEGVPSRMLKDRAESPKTTSGKNNPVHETGDQKFETELLKVVLFSCYKDLIADIEGYIEDEELRKIFQLEYEKRKKRGKYKLASEEAEKIIDGIISEFNENRYCEYMKDHERHYDQRITQMLKLFGQPNDQGEYRLKPEEPKKII